jgi:hypothetical protein
MYVLIGDKRAVVRWPILVGIITILFVLLLWLADQASTPNSVIVMNLCFVTGLGAIYFYLRHSHEESRWKPWENFLNSPIRFTIFLYMIYGSLGMSFIIRDRIANTLPQFSFTLICLLTIFPDALLFLRARAGNGLPVYEKANRVAFWMLIIVLFIPFAAGFLAGD